MGRWYGLGHRRVGFVSVSLRPGGDLDPMHEAEIPVNKAARDRLFITPGES